ncbi:NlpC/P60 family protein [Emcibacter sp.]|uniref:C40 family peptidase n=1 Tax=Emcibacter sp. TaxID=1979954 RepID=UPI002AA73A5A|nr:NlpC/P60 family protein [Emcibacter sp.]
MSQKEPDPRTSPYRQDIAADFLKGTVEVDKYVQGTQYQVAHGIAPLYATPDRHSPLSSQLLYGELFTVFEEKDGWAWGQAERDSYVGYCPIEYLSPDIFDSTHHVEALSTHIYAAPDPKSEPVRQVFQMSEVSVADPMQVKGFVRLVDGNWIYATHVSSHFGTDPVSEALKLLYAPYLWGGKSSAGLDCSALIQLAFATTGIRVPRDSDMQEAAIGEALEDDDVPQRGDIAFFPGHVGFMLDDMHLLHANAHHMRVSIDPLKDVINIVSFQTDKPPLSCIKRITTVLPEG